MAGLHVSQQQYRVSYNIFALITIVFLIFFQLGIYSSFVFFPVVLSRITAFLFAVPGAALMIACIIKYFKQLSGLGKGSGVGQLEVTGLHNFIRHPLYLGTFMFLIGLFIWRPLYSNLITVLIIIIYTMIGIRFEEKKLILKFGNDYILYQKRVNMILPIF